MSTVKKLTKKTKSPRISKEELELLQKGRGIKAQLADRLASLELQKAEVISNMIAVDREFSEHLGKLEFKYGKINVNAETGEYTKVKDDADESDS